MCNTPQETTINSNQSHLRVLIHVIIARGHAELFFGLVLDFGGTEGLSRKSRLTRAFKAPAKQSAHLRERLIEEGADVLPGGDHGHPACDLQVQGVVVPYRA